LLRTIHTIAAMTIIAPMPITIVGILMLLHKYIFYLNRNMVRFKANASRYLKGL